MSTQSDKACTQNPVLQHLAETLLFTSTDHFGEPLDSFHTICDFAPRDLAKLYTEFQHFIDKVEGLVTAEVGGDWDTLEDFYLGMHSDGCVERDYIYSRNHEGTGFWDTGRWYAPVGKILNEVAKSQPEICCTESDKGEISII